MSKSLIKLIDVALIPAAIMICGKVAGLCFANLVFNLNWGILTDPNNFFSVKIVYETLNQQIIATSYSNLMMYLFVLIGFTFILIRALYFHSSHISPKILAKLATNNLLNLIANSFEIYYQSSVWLIMLWLAFFALFINVLLGNSFVWTCITTFISNIVATTLLLRDVTKEIKISKKNLPKIANNNFQTS